MELKCVLELLLSAKKLERDKGLAALQQNLDQQQPNSELAEIEVPLMSVLHNQQSTWEAKHGALMGAKVLTGLDGASDDFLQEIKGCCLQLLNDTEARVRLAAGELLGALCRRQGCEVYLLCREDIFNGVKPNLARAPLGDTMLDEQTRVDHLVEKLASGTSPPGSSVAEHIFHDTAGWNHLETWMRCLQSVIEGCGSQFLPFIDQELLDLIFQTLTHTNRFVRETGFYVCSSLVSCSTSLEDGVENMELSDGHVTNTILQHGDQLAHHLALGLADNWSQVRLAASTATRHFLLNLPTESARQRFYPTLLPRLCLNRYYVAEGVRIYSQETWRQVTGSRGKELVEQHIDHVVEFYIQQSDADNHAVREAACACIAELGSKIDKDAVRSHVQRLLEALLVCFKDDSWPVRDAACVACGNFVRCFPEESRQSMPDLYPLFFENLRDNIPSVRQGAAAALANVVRAYGDEASEFLMTKISEGIKGLENQPASSERYSGLDKGPATYGVVKQLRDNDMELHSNQQMYSCGSLAPKMGRGREGGCMDHKFRRPPEPWELCDGCIDLLTELSTIQSLASHVASFLPMVAGAGHRQDYPQHVALLETICNQLPILARNLGKRHFKPHLELFFDIIFEALSSDSALTSNSASQCLDSLSNFLGPNILRGRIEQHNPAYLSKMVPHHPGRLF
ncbi:uncharacterized protein [Diadema antillarum]|uniref:uncharacterized protein n=2 Tax=Diadema antillarum TaxID=105358 RepID=UPI003A86082A